MLKRFTPQNRVDEDCRRIFPSTSSAFDATCAADTNPGALHDPFNDRNKRRE
jgi:hypothetical protein